TDEHGQKVQDAARANGINPQIQADRLVVRFQEVWERLHVEYDDFIRTTQDRHTRVVTAVLQDLWDRGEIYLGEYEGWYCVPDERFWTEKDVTDQKCPDCGRPVEWLSEQNYFFRMGKHQEWLIEYIESHPGFIRPENRRSEVLGYLRKPLGDLCISRPAERVSWGIPLPFDPAYVTYVWFDALLNYVTAAGYISDDRRFSDLWSTATHLIGKDILTLHTVLWPTMLRAAGLPLPRTIFAHGWWLLGGAKMSKSLGNVVKPLDLADFYGVDALRFYLMGGMVAGRDADFDEDVLRARYQSTLANDLGNLLHRLIDMIGRYCDGRVPTPGTRSFDGDALRQRCEGLPDEVFEHMDAFAVNEAVASIVATVRDINRYVEHAAPWAAAKEGRTTEVETALYTAAEALRITSVLLWPVMPERMAELWRRLGWQPSDRLSEALSWGGLKPCSPVAPAPPLFPRLDA
ncbi:MAG: class I tRNA ligase family protein, partial [Candidatus Latescibacteria bacterium]|nr:class I tRNA ligase family protein [Candidatus Latescibacterota bacterium]